MDAVEVRPEQAEPVPRRQRPRQQAPLDVAVEKGLGEIVEEGVAEERVVGRGEAAAGDRGDDVDVLQQRSPAGAVRHLAQAFHHAEREGGGPGAAAREGDDDEEVVAVVAVGREIRIPIPDGGVLAVQLGVDRRHRLVVEPEF